MKAIAVFPESRKLDLIDVVPPRVTSAHHVMLKILEVGVCGTDREIASFQYGTPPDGSEHLIIGHEALAEVVEVGPGVTHVRPGDLVVPMVRRPCPHDWCTACRAGQQDFCFTGDFTERGIKGRHGFMTEFVLDDEQYLNVVPRELRDLGVLTEPLTIAEKALTQIWQVQQRLPWACEHDPKKGPGHCHHAVVIGAGPVGLLGAMRLLTAGFKTYVYSKSASPTEKTRLVESLGATYVSTQQASIDDLAESVGNIDVVYEAAGASRAAFDVMKVLGTNGVFVFTGVPGRKAPVELDTDLIMRNLVLKNQIVFGTVNAARGAYESAIDNLRVFQDRWPDALRSLITARYAPEDYSDLLTGKVGGIKNVMVFTRAS